MTMIVTLNQQMMPEQSYKLTGMQKPDKQAIKGYEILTNSYGRF